MEELLKNMGIYALRNLARDLGIRAPTTKVKKVLIYEIMCALEGRDFPRRNSLAGRKPINKDLTDEMSGLEYFSAIILYNISQAFFRLSEQLRNNISSKDKALNVKEFQDYFNKNVNILIDNYISLDNVNCVR